MIDDREIKIGNSVYFKHFIPNNIRQAIILLTIAHLFGLYKYPRKKTTSPQVEEALCPKCKIQMSLKSWNCKNCGGIFDYPS